jgi:hypothetical protein
MNLGHEAEVYHVLGVIRLGTVRKSGSETGKKSKGMESNAHTAQTPRPLVVK